MFILTIITISFYLLASLLLIGRVVHSKLLQSANKWLFLTPALIASLMHVNLLFPLIQENGINLAISHAFSLIMWLVVFILIIAAIFKPLENLGIVLYPIVIISILLNFYFPQERYISTHLNLHIIISILAYSVLLLTAFQAILTAIQDYRLHERKSLYWLDFLPSLQTMEKLLFQMLALGFILLSLSLISGFLFLENIFAQHLVHKTILSLMAWLVFAVLLFGRVQFGWRGKIAIHWTLGGIVLLLLAYFGTKIVIELILKY